ncbi:hypothetical protein BDV24DRAFT_158333 [Aspergillus arachidicola]|uniref:Uncharacterized protein n=1 Tax=Aspergillus arachidicola TaxID=656916 RepID=A0A5N6YPC9_9EURO|nr:hypothetical protein BDV24DRAFT_158333 [Aspergillus arachidicola]
MKIQTLFSLAAVGLAFATPIHNLDERGVVSDAAECIVRSIQEGLSKAFDSVSESNSGLKGLDGLTSCITNAATEVTDLSDLTQDPLEWLHSLDCGQELSEDKARLENELAQLIQLSSSTLRGIVANVVQCTSTQ